MYSYMLLPPLKCFKTKMPQRQLVVSAHDLPATKASFVFAPTLSICVS